MEQHKKILHPPEGLRSIHGFYYKKGQIILLYSTSSREDAWIEIYKENHFNNKDIINWCQSHYISYQILDNKNSKIYKAFIREKTNYNA